MTWFSSPRRRKRIAIGWRGFIPLEDLVYYLARPEATQENLLGIDRDAARRGRTPRRDLAARLQRNRRLLLAGSRAGRDAERSISRTTCASPRRSPQSPADAAVDNAFDAPSSTAEVLKNKAGERLDQGFQTEIGLNAPELRRAGGDDRRTGRARRLEIGRAVFRPRRDRVLVARYILRTQRAIDALLKELDVLYGYGSLGGGLGGLGGGLSTVDTQGER